MSRETMTPEIVSKEYDAGLQFNSGLDLYNCVEMNENFFIGKQWEGVQSNGLPTPVFNFLKRVVLFSTANISTDNLKLWARAMSSSGQRNTQTLELVADILNDQFAAIFEHNSIGGRIREFTRNAAVDGDGCLYTYWDSEAETGQPSKGAIRTEALMNTQVFFGNPNNRDVQSQPYIILERRMLLREARKRAERFGQDAGLIQPDSKAGGSGYMDTMSGSGNKVTVLLRLWKDEETGTVHAYECTRQAEIRGDIDLGIRLYPVTWMNWDYVQDCYHGQAMITGLLPNQIFVNKLFALSMISLMTLAYPKVVFDSTKVSKWTNKIGGAIPVNGSVEGVAKIIDPASISPQISQFIDIAISYTQKFLGASDVALGDTRPDNTSAIIALQRAAATPMELTKQSLLQSIEDLGRVYMEFMGEYYGERYVEISNPYDSSKIVVPFDFSILKEIPFTIGLDAGAASYWSEIAAMQTLDNLLMQGKISTVEYLKRLPAGQITDKEALIQALQQQEAAMTGGGMGMQEPAASTEEEAIPIRGGAGYGQLQRKINETGEVPKTEV